MWNILLGHFGVFSKIISLGVISENREGSIKIPFVILNYSVVGASEVSCLQSGMSVHTDQTAEYYVSLTFW